MATKKKKPEVYWSLSPEEEKAVAFLSTDPLSRAEAKVLAKSIIDLKKMLRGIFGKLTDVMEEYRR